MNTIPIHNSRQDANYLTSFNNLYLPIWLLRAFRFAFLPLRSLLLIALSIMFFAPLANATTYYVAKTGNDKNPGTLASPWLTVTKAANTLVAGDTVYIRAGSYLEQVTPVNSGNSGSLITYTAYPGEAAIISGINGLNWTWNGVFDLTGRSYLQISGLIIINSPGFGIFMSGSSNIQILNNCIKSTYYSGIYASGSNTITLNGNEVMSANTGMDQESISIDAQTTNFVVSNNRVHDGNTEGIDAKAGASNGKIFGNIVYNMARIGIYVDAQNSSANNIQIYNNTVSNSNPVPSGAGEDGIRIGAEQGGSASSVSIYNNIVYNIAGSGITLSNYTEPGFGSPKFSNVSIYNNTTYNCGTRDSNYGGGIDIANTIATGIIIQNNILSQNRYFPIRLISQPNVVIINNLIDKSTYPQDPNATNGTNSVIGSPLFTDIAGNNFKTPSSSPAINTGAAMPSLTVDSNWEPRPQGGKFDIGAFEYGL